MSLLLKFKQSFLFVLIFFRRYKNFYIRKIKPLNGFDKIKVKK